MQFNGRHDRLAMRIGLYTLAVAGLVVLALANVPVITPRPKGNRPIKRTPLPPVSLVVSNGVVWFPLELPLELP